MVIAARRAYKDAIRWTRAARTQLGPPDIARRSLFAFMATAIVILGLIGLTAPSRFGASRTHWSWWALAVLVLLAVAALARNWRRWTAPILGDSKWTEDEVAAAASALESCPAAFRTRYSVGWVWGPLALTALAAILSLSAAYFLVDAVLALGSIGPEQALLCVGQMILAIILLWIGAPRLTTIRFARQANRRASGF
jgi:hypothetical protein